MMQSVDRSAAVMLAVSLVCVAGIGLTAASIDTANPVGADKGNQIINPPSPQEAVDVGGNVGAGSGQAEGTGGIGSSYASVTTCIPFLNSTLGTMLVLASVLAIAGLVYYRYNFALALFAGWTILPPTMLGYFLMTDCATTGGSLLSSVGGGALSTPGKGLVGVSGIPPWAMGGFAFLIVGSAATLLYRASGSDEEVTLDTESETEDVELDQFAAAAGRAADRIEEHNQDVDNSVYRAWVEMTGLLDVDSPETYSAGEFEEAAVDVGMNRDDVSELTRLFNEVRYGDRDAETRESRAVDVLRNIEEEYGTTPDDANVHTNDIEQTDGDEPSTETAGDDSSNEPAADSADDADSSNEVDDR